MSKRAIRSNPARVSRAMVACPVARPRSIKKLELIVYSRRGCHLCELLLGELEPLVRGRARIIVRDVDERPDWQKAYGERVPVVFGDGDMLCECHLDKSAVLEKLAPAGPT